MNENVSHSGVKTSTVFRKPIPKIAGLSPPVTATELLADTTIVRPQELVAGLLHQGTKCVVASASKAGKTWLLLDLALSVATGTKFLHWPTIKGKVLFINFELQKAFIKERLDILKSRRQIETTDNLVIWNLRGRTADFEALILNVIQEVEGKGYTLIILDPIYKAMVGKGENMGSSVGVLCNQLERLAERSGAAVLYSHHFPKGDAKKKAVIDRMAGSGVFARDADTIFVLTEHETDNCYTVEMVLRNFPDQPPFVVQFDYPVMVEREDLDPEDLKLEEDENGD
jgi:RecA-family ATPase